MRPDNPPSPIATFRYHNPPRSGNAINGLGESQWRRPRKVFHRVPMGDDDREPADWKALDFYFNMIVNLGGDYFGLGAVRHVLLNRWQLRRANGPVATERLAVPDPVAMSAQIRADITSRHPKALVGFTRLSENAVYDDETLPYKNAICIGYPMDRGRMSHVPQPSGIMEVMRIYRETARIAVETSERIRAMGWPAKAYGDTKSTEMLHIPLAIAAGLGELGKHGSMISLEYGSNFRLSTVLTDLPLEVGAPVDIAVDDLCLGCRRCTIDCPPGAIFDAKQMVRGVEKWYVDFDKCIHYFVETGGCAICIEVCPWSEPGRGPGLAEKLLARRGRGSRTPRSAS